jgi:hypothetical protein
MRMRRRLGVAAVVVLTLGLAAAIPVVIWTPSGAAAPAPDMLVPQELSGDLFEECAPAFTVPEPLLLIPESGADGVLTVVLATIDETNSELDYVEPTAEQSMQLEELNACFAQWPIDPTWYGPPSFTAMQAELFDDYVIRVLTPCLRMQGLDGTDLSVDVQTIDVAAWYFRQFESLGLEASLAVVNACPLVPSYLSDIEYPQRMENVFG